jgi:predicted TIM-barrel fold metal-dependent hydrolase
MDEQGLGGAIFLPTLGVGMEQALIHDPPALVAAFRAFNRWLDEDWGFSYRERIFAAPILTFVDPDELVREIDRGLGRDARFFVVVPGPIVTPSGARSPADPVYDPAWARIAESGVTLALHGGDSRYTQYLADWGEAPGLESFRPNRFREIASWNHTQDYFANLLVHGLYHRFPNLRMASIETGSDWVFHLFDKLGKVYMQTPDAFPEDPRKTFRRHVWVSPYYEDDLAALRDLLGAERVLMGSDYPHAEGLAEPTTYIRDLESAGYAAADARLVMRENGLALSRSRPA